MKSFLSSRLGTRVTFFLIALQLVPQGIASGMPMSEASSPSGALPRLGILRIGGQSEAAEEASALVQKRLQRWMENIEGSPAAVEPIPGPARAAQIELEEERARLAHAADLVMKGQETDMALLETLSERLSTEGSRFSPDVQKALVALALTRFRHGDKEAARKLLFRAVTLHPDALVLWNAWDNENGEAAAFDALLSQVAHGFQRACHVSLEVTPSDAFVEVNGFEMKGRRTFQLGGNVPYTFRAWAPGYKPVEIVSRCGTAVKKQLSFKLSVSGKGETPDPALLQEISRRRGVDALCLIEPKGEELKLYLYTPSLALEEIPLRAPLRVAEVLERPSESSMPIATDAFLALWEKHRGKSSPADDSLDLSPRLSSRPLSPITGETRESVGEGTKWYNSPTFWWIAGGVAAGVVATFLITRNGENVKSQGGLSIKID